MAQEISPEKMSQIFVFTKQLFAQARQSGLNPAEATIALGMAAKAVVLSTLPQSAANREAAIENARYALLQGFEQEFDSGPPTSQ